MFDKSRDSTGGCAWCGGIRVVVLHFVVSIPTYYSSDGNPSFKQSFKPFQGEIWTCLHVINLTLIGFWIFFCTHLISMESKHIPNERPNATERTKIMLLSEKDVRNWEMYICWYKSKVLNLGFVFPNDTSQYNMEIRQKSVEVDVPERSVPSHHT